jgi:hypothetical protein
MPTIVQRVSNAGAQGRRWRATPNAHRRKDQTVKISEKREETTSQGWLIFTAVNWLSFIALQTISVRFHRHSIVTALMDYALCGPIPGGSVEAAPPIEVNSPGYKVWT